MAEAVLVVGALDCSTKSRARERNLPSGRKLPKPRSEQHPMGVPGLGIEDQRRVSKDNLACDFILDQMQTVIDRGGGALRENPARSLHWHIPREVEMEQSGQWTDTFYDACCFMGARHKRQRLRHNLLEVAQWPPLECHHFHHPQEWQPWESGGGWVYSPTSLHDSHFSYIGRGHHSHRLPVTQWACAFVPGHNCGADEWMALYTGHIMSNLAADLKCLEGLTLVCDCPLQTVCEGDLLAGMVLRRAASREPPCQRWAP